MTDYMYAKTENIQKFLDNCLKKQKHEIIEEFLRDWKWGRAFKKHRKSHRLKYRCICRVASWEYWKWCEKKWEELLK